MTVELPLWVDDVGELGLRDSERVCSECNLAYNRGLAACPNC